MCPKRVWGSGPCTQQQVDQWRFTFHSGPLARHQNLYQTVAYAKNRFDPTLLKGFMAAPWLMTTREDRFRLLDDAERLYAARQKLYPETL